MCWNITWKFKWPSSVGAFQNKNGFLQTASTLKQSNLLPKNRKLKHNGLFLFKVIQIYADPLIEVRRGRMHIRICSLHSKETNVYVWRPAGMSDPLSGECVCVFDVGVSMGYGYIL